MAKATATFAASDPQVPGSMVAANAAPTVSIAAQEEGEQTENMDETARMLPLLHDSEKQFLSNLRERLPTVPAQIGRQIESRKSLTERGTGNDSEVTDVLLIWEETRKTIPGYESLDGAMHVTFRIQDEYGIHARLARQFLGEINYKGPQEYVSEPYLMTADLASHVKALVQECEDWLTVAARDRGIIGVGAKLDDSAIRQLAFKVRTPATPNAGTKVGEKKRPNKPPPGLPRTARGRPQDMNVLNFLTLWGRQIPDGVTLPATPPTEAPIDRHALSLLQHARAGTMTAVEEAERILRPLFSLPADLETIQQKMKAIVNAACRNALGLHVEETTFRGQPPPGSDERDWLILPTSIACDRVVVVEDDSDENYLRLWMEKILPPDQWQRFSTGMIFLHCGGRPTGEGVNHRLDAIRQIHRDSTNFQPKAFVVVDRDYRLDEELETERAKLSQKAFARQQWHVWQQRVEIENYMICPDAIVCYIVDLENEAPVDARFPPPHEKDVRTMVELAINSSRDAARHQLTDAFARANKGHAPSTSVKGAEQFLNTEWQGDGRIFWCDAKEVVLPCLKRECKQRWNLAFSEEGLIRSFSLQNIPVEVVQLVNEMASFLNESFSLRLDEAEREAVRPLTDALKNRDASIRRTAAEALGTRGPAALPPLSRALQDADVEVRRAAAQSLLCIGRNAAPAVPALSKAFTDNDRQVRELAATTLGAIGKFAKAAVPHLIECLKSDEWVGSRQCAATALGRIGEAEHAVQSLVTALSDPDVNVRAAASEALGNIGPASAVAIPSLLIAITDMSNGGESVRQNAAFALGKIGQATPDILQALRNMLKDPHLDRRRFAARALGDLGGAATSEVAALLELLGDKEVLVREDAIGRIGGSTGLVVPALVTTLKDQGPPVRAKAAEVLGKIGADATDAVPRLERLASEDESGTVRVKCASALVMIRGQAELSVPILSGLLTDPTAYEAANEALRALGSAAVPAVPGLVKALCNDYGYARLQAAYTLGELGPLAAEATPALAMVLLDDKFAIGSTKWGDGPGYDSVRYVAAVALGKIGPGAKAALPALREASKYQKAVRIAAEEAVRRIEQPIEPASSS